MPAPPHSSGGDTWATRAGARRWPGGWPLLAATCQQGIDTIQSNHVAARRAPESHACSTAGPSRQHTPGPATGQEGIMERN